MELKTVTGVEVLSTGSYSLATGDAEFTEQHLADAVRASTDPTVPAPRIKLGHDFDAIFGDGAPAFGKLANMRLTNNGQTIVADLVDVPAWLADGLPAHYPARSIEGGFGFDAPSGHHYSLAIQDLALLGAEWPGVTSLADLTVSDLETVLTANGRVAEATEADGGYALAGGTAATLVSAKMKPAEAKLAVGDFRRVFARDLFAGKVPKMTAAGEQPNWWTRSVEAGDDGKLRLVIDDEAGHLIELPVEVEGEGLKYGAPSFREAVAASGKGPRVLASWPSKGGSPSTEKRQGMKRDEMLKRLGLPEDATDEAMFAALAEKPDALKAETPAGDDGGDSGDGDEGSGDGSGDGADSEEREPVAAGAGKVPEGMVLVDKDTFETVKAGAAAGASVASKLATDHRDSTITAAINKGKFAVGRREHYTKAWDADPEGTEAVIASLAEGLVPVSETGRAGDGDGGDTAGEDAIMDAYFERHFPKAHARLRGDERRHGVTVRTEA